MGTIANTFTFLVWGILALVVLWRLVRSIRKVPQRKAYIIERLGRYHQTRTAGLALLVPFIDKVANILDLKEETIEVPPQECFTKDEVNVMVDGVIYMSVVDPEKAAYGITHYAYAAMQLAQTTTRSVIGQLALDRTFEERDHISMRVVNVLSETGRQWGIQVHRYEIKNIQPPETVHRSMELQVTAERDRKAMISKANGDKQSRINRSEGYKTELINKSEGEKQKRINEAEGKAAEIVALAGATAASIEKLAEAIHIRGGAEAVKLQLTEQYLNQVAHLAKKETDILLPANLGDLNSMLNAVGLD